MTKRRKKTKDEEVLQAYEAGQLASASHAKAEIRHFRDAARATLVKDQRVNVRLSSALLDGLKARALEEGLPYQTLIASVLHKFVTGRLVDQYVFPKTRRAKDVPHAARLHAGRKAVRVSHGR